MRKTISTLFFTLFWLIVLGYSLGILATRVSPDQFWPLSFFGLLFPFFVLFLLIYLFYWFYSSNKKVIYPFVILIMGTFFSPRIFATSFFTNQTSEDELRIMSYNVRNFELYTDNKGNKRDDIIALIQEQEPDILCLQEVVRGRNFMEFEDLGKTLGLPHFYFNKTQTGINQREYGIVTLSKFPIVDTKHFKFDNSGNTGIQTNLLVETDTIAVFNLHLASLRFDNQDLEYLKELKTEGTKTKNKRVNTLSIIRKLKNGFIRRSLQSKSIRNVIEKTKHPVIVCGDFNDTQNSFAYRKIKGKLQDTFHKGNWGLGQTYVNILPILRIDHIFVSNRFKVLDHDIVQEQISDHYPVVVKIERKE